MGLPLEIPKLRRQLNTYAPVQSHLTLLARQGGTVGEARSTVEFVVGHLLSADSISDLVQRYSDREFHQTLSKL